MPRTQPASVLLALAFLAGVGSPVPAAPTPADLLKVREIGPQARVISSTLTHAWKEQSLQPTPMTTDHQFLRRVSLDLIGRIATPSEIRNFVQDNRPDKRIRLVEQLLRHPDFARNWASVWTRILLPQPVPPEHAEQLRAWLQEQFQRDLSYKDLFVRLLTATGKNTENGATLYVLSHLGSPNPAQDWVEQGQFTMDSLTDHSCRTFLGIRIDCCRCHDHPFTAERKQTHWWGLNGFFRQVERSDSAGPKGQPPVLLLRDNLECNKDGRLFFPRRNGAIFAIQPKYLDGTGLKPGDRRPRRQVLAELMSRDKEFARTIVNRLWTHFLGQPMNESGPFDDSGENNPILHKELLDYLTDQFVAGGWDLKKLMLWLCTSDVYQLQFRPTKQILEPGLARYCSSMSSKFLGPEQRLESILTALRARDVLGPEQLARVREGWDKAQTPPQPNPVCTGCAGFIPPLEAVPLESWRFLHGSQELYDALTHPSKGTVARILADGPASTGRIVDAIYLAALNHPATPREIARMQREVRALTREQDRIAFWQDLLWVLLHSSEFLANY